jgi:hypothetical protein
MFISQAWAQAAEAAAPQSSLLTSMLPLLVIFVLFYLLILRPQTKKIREHQSLLQALKPGDKVVTAGGNLCHRRQGVRRGRHAGDCVWRACQGTEAHD